MKEEIDYEALGRRIREARIKKKLTQENVADEIDVTPTYISSIENGKTKTSLQTLIKLAGLLDTSLDYLVYDNVPYMIEQYDLDAKAILQSCTEKERQVILDMMAELKRSLTEHHMK